MADIKDRAREYIAKHSEYSEVFGQTFVAVDTLTAMVEFAEQETKALKEQIGKMKCCHNCKNCAVLGTLIIWSVYYTYDFIKAFHKE